MSVTKETVVTYTLTCDGCGRQHEVVLDHAGSVSSDSMLEGTGWVSWPSFNADLHACSQGCYVELAVRDYQSVVRGAEAVA